MANSVLRRLYRASLLPSLVICLPGLLLVFWYAWSAYAQLDRYRRAVRQNAPFALETLHIALHDQVETDVRRMWMAPPPNPSQLDSYVLHLSRQDYSSLEESVARSEDRPYVDAKLESGSRVLDAKVRLKGDRHWHVGGAQKSLKIKLDKGELIAGHRVFNLINDPTPLVIGEQLILDLARQVGLLTPVSDFVRLKINAKDFGVFHYETAADESLLRNARRLPGSIYASELPANAAAEELWASPRYWSKVASRTDSDLDKTERADLERLLHQIRNATTREFYDFAQHELDLAAFAELDALDVAFGGDQRDFRENHSYYFDPYRGTWEPLAGQFRGFRDDPLFNLVDNPLLLRLKLTPGYLSLRDRKLYEFLTGPGAPAALRAHATRLLERLAPELATDPYWDAYRQLPRIDAFHRRMVRPNTLHRLALVVESEFTTYNHRHAQLVRELERNPLYLELGAAERRAVLAAPRAAQLEFRTPLRLLVDGHAGVGLNELSVGFRDDCVGATARLARFGVEVPTHGSAGQLELDSELPLYPSVQVVARSNPSPRRGTVRGEEIPIDYPFELLSSCAAERVVARGRHLATDSRVVSRPAPKELLARLPARRLDPNETPSLALGEAATHPWQLEAPPPREVQLGPGEVQVPATRVFEADETVTVPAGTHLRMGAGSSLVFLGRVRFLGQRHAPIVLSALGDQPWGGVALQGPATHGSEWHSVELSGGTRPSFRSVDYPALVDVHDTSDILFEDCHFGAQASKQDTLHFAYVRHGEIRDSYFHNGPADAVDLEYSSVALRLVRIVGSGDDGLDLMGSQVKLSDSVILGAHGNGVSAGEETRVDVQNSLVADGKVGVLAKNAAQVALSSSLLFRNGTGVRTYQRTVRYAGPSEVSANVLYVAGSGASAVQRDDRPQNGLDQGRVLLDLPQPGALDHLLEDVLELSDWQQLPKWIEEQKGQAIR